MKIGSRSLHLIAIGASLACFALSIGQRPRAHQKAPTRSAYAPVGRILAAKCLGCHNDKRHPENVNLTSYATVMKSGSHGPIVVARRPGKSKIYTYVDGEKKPRMPFKAAPLTKGEISTIRAWIAAGARR